MFNTFIDVMSDRDERFEKRRRFAEETAENEALERILRSHQQSPRLVERHLEQGDREKERVSQLEASAENFQRQLGDCMHKCSSLESSEAALQKRLSEKETELSDLRDKAGRRLKVLEDRVVELISA